MSDVLSKGSNFPASLMPEFIKKTRGESALAKLCTAKPIPFNGIQEFTFQLDKEVDLVAENGAKTKGGATVIPVTIVPVKLEYGARISDEFLYASEESQLDYMTAFAEGFAKKVARGIDLMAFHGINPRTGTASAVIGDNNFDKKVTQVVTIAEGDKPDTNIDAAIALVQGSDCDVNGIVLAPVFRSNLAAQTKVGGDKLYPDLAWGNNPGVLNGLPIAVNSTVSANENLDRAIVGDFANCFKWGYAKEIPIEIIKYGNPDNDVTLGDLKGHNQIYLRGEMYVGWGILDPNAFALVKDAK